MCLPCLARTTLRTVTNVFITTIEEDEEGKSHQKRNKWIKNYIIHASYKILRFMHTW